MSAETSEPGSRRTTPEKDGGRNVDQAALLGAALTAVLALVLSPGGWAPLGTMIGVTLLVLVFAFFRLGHDKDGKVRPRNLLAVSTVVALCAGLALGYPLQKFLVATDVITAECDALGQVAKAEKLDLDRRLVPLAAPPVLSPGFTIPSQVQDPLSTALEDAFTQARDDCRGNETTSRLPWVIGFVFLVCFLVTFVISRRGTPGGLDGRLVGRHG